MTIAQRIQVRRSLMGQGFRRTGYTNDLSGVGDYAETWTHPDGTTIEVNLSARESNAETPPSAPAPVSDCPGMYDQPDAGLSFPLPTSEEEDRIPLVDYSGSMTPALLDQAANEADALAANMPPSRFTQARPEVFAPFQHREVTITCYEDEETETLTGYPVDAWRFSPTALAVRVVFDPAKPESGDYIVLPDDFLWDITPADGATSYHHAPKVTL